MRSTRVLRYIDGGKSKDGGHCKFREEKVENRKLNELSCLLYCLSPGNKVVNFTTSKDHVLECFFSLFTLSHFLFACHNPLIQSLQPTFLDSSYPCSDKHDFFQGHWRLCLIFRINITRIRVDIYFCCSLILFTCLKVSNLRLGIIMIKVKFGRVRELF
eukprot:TRINITY_DN16269_c1_g2_i1.p1 TRINITY_DN16269_c1_g2~~TRINITY_DN16269_c1_g2_i1.p1  ORF type:complete len:159 (+),score=4.20 TRINITY_DN16269_c1_g2_i1:196-672(+)